MKNQNSIVRSLVSGLFGLVAVVGVTTFGGCGVYNRVAGETGLSSEAAANRQEAKAIDQLHEGLAGEIAAWNESNPGEKAEEAYSPPNIFSSDPTGYFAASSAKKYDSYKSTQDKETFDAVIGVNRTLVDRMYEFTVARLEGAVNAAQQAGSVTPAEKKLIDDRRKAALRLAEYRWIYSNWSFNSDRPDPNLDVMRVRTARLSGFTAPQLASLDGVSTAQPEKKTASGSPDIDSRDVQRGVSLVRTATK